MTVGRRSLKKKPKEKEEKEEEEGEETLDGRSLDYSGFYCLNVTISRLCELDLPLGIRRMEAGGQKLEASSIMNPEGPHNAFRTSPE